MALDRRASVALLLTCFVLAKAVPLQRRGTIPESGFLSHFLSQADGLAGSNVLGSPPEQNYANHGSAIASDGDGKYKPDMKYVKSKHDHLGYDDRDFDDSMHDEDDEDPYYGSAVFCRLAVFRGALNSTQCSEVKIKEDNSDYYSRNDETKGVCRWDRSLGRRQRSGCLCPRLEKDCKRRKECHWRVLADDRDQHNDEGHCIHNSERFYNILARLLAKRGKKDLSLKVLYSSAPAKGNLPYGPHGPAEFGEGSDDHLGLYLDHYGVPGGYASSYGYGFDPYGIHQNPYGNGLDPYGIHQNPYGQGLDAYDGQRQQYIEPQGAAFPPHAGYLPVDPTSQHYLPPQQIPQYFNNEVYPAVYNGNFAHDLTSQQYFPSQQAPLPEDYHPQAPEAYGPAYGQRSPVVPTPEACAQFCSLQQQAAVQYPLPQDYHQAAAGVLPGYN